jgi:uncharacterized membrane protein
MPGHGWIVSTQETDLTMESRLKAFGHAIHPMLIPFPLGLLSTAVTFDIIHFITGTTVWSDGAFYMIAAGIIGGLAAAIFGLIDWLAIPSGTRAKAVGLYHGGGNVVVAVLFALSWLLRYGDYSHPSGITFILVLGIMKSSQS